ncbi:hypothetical protein E3N88_34768 [Mikania micrantha]|uniref:Uncharacterized protein n=1 Tax=Mikania micrantha TaxID=192012 RepID=A0A5N6LZ82_9ASTR|nr:hypothetical protein E3N88_34768 [Mikania micrantha]
MATQAGLNGPMDEEERSELVEVKTRVLAVKAKEPPPSSLGSELNLTPTTAVLVAESNHRERESWPKMMLLRRWKLGSGA